MTGRRRHRNIIYDLQEKEMPRRENLHRRNMNVMRKLVCQKSSKFKMVWEKHSKYPINFEKNKLYFENYRSCYTCCGKNGVPQLLYKLPVCTPSQKIEDAIMCSVQLDKLLEEKRGWRPSLFTLTADNRLIRYDVETGELLQDVFLSVRYKFRHLSWETDPKTLLLRSVHTRHTVMARAAGISQPLLMVLAVLSVFPLEFIAMLEIDKNVFGKDVCDAMIAHSTLVVTHQNGLVKLYSFQHILEKHTIIHSKLGSECDGMQGIVGKAPLGLPCNIKLTECPPALFTVRCHSLQIGGFPWHYIISPYKASEAGSFQIYCYESQQRAVDGVLDYESSTLEPDKCLFHPDDSGRILHIGANTLRVFGIRKMDTGQTEIHKCFEIDTAHKHTPQVTNDTPSCPGMFLSSSGRIIKKRFKDLGIEPEYETLQSFDYEDDLDLIGLTVIRNENDECSKGVVSFYDNDTGTHLKDLPFEETWNEICDHTVCIDIDVIVHIVKEPSRKFHCYLYRLDRDIPDEEILEEKTFPKKRRKNTRRRTCDRNIDTEDSGSSSCHGNNVITNDDNDNSVSNGCHGNSPNANDEDIDNSASSSCVGDGS